MTKRILVIDDDLGVRLTVYHVLTSAGYDVRLVCDGKQALGIFRNFKPDVVITDLVMPSMEGVDIIGTLKKVRSPAKIIAMSGGARLGRTNILQLAQDAGADAILGKPFTIEQLKNVLLNLSDKGQISAHFN